MKPCRWFSFEFHKIHCYLHGALYSKEHHLHGASFIIQTPLEVFVLIITTDDEGVCTSKHQVGYSLEPIFVLTVRYLLLCIACVWYLQKSRAGRNTITDLLRVTQWDT